MAIIIYSLFIAGKVLAQNDMTFAIGSTNIIKIQALEEVLLDYPEMLFSRLIPFAVPSGIEDQPLSLEITIQEAKNRAKNAFEACEGCKYGFGIESGLMQAPGTQTGYFETSICAIYDGSVYYLGIASGFEVPPQILDRVLNQNLNLAEACFQSGVTGNPKLGSSEGLIGILTKGRIDRKQNAKQCIITALIQLENAPLYTPQSLEILEK